MGPTPVTTRDIREVEKDKKAETEELRKAKETQHSAGKNRHKWQRLGTIPNGSKTTGTIGAFNNYRREQEEDNLQGMMG
jgi:hypothetical protein